MVLSSASVGLRRACAGVEVVLLFGITGGFACLGLLCVIAGFWYSGFGLCLWLVVLEVLYFAVLCGLCGSFWVLSGCFFSVCFWCGADSCLGGFCGCACGCWVRS